MKKLVKMMEQMEMIKLVIMRVRSVLGSWEFLATQELWSAFGRFLNNLIQSKETWAKCHCYSFLGIMGSRGRLHIVA